MLTKGTGNCKAMSPTACKVFFYFGLRGVNFVKIVFSDQNCLKPVDKSLSHSIEIKTYN